MSEKQVGFGILGCGVIAPFHAQGVKKTPEARLVALCDTVRERARKLAEEERVDFYTSDYVELLKRRDVDVVCLCTPSSLHAEETVLAARAGKHVLTEKPMAVTLKDADRMIRACREAGVKLGCIFQRRVTEPFPTIKKAIEAGELGRVVLVDAYMKYYRSQEYYDSAGWRGTWEFDGGGALMNQGIHCIDLVIWFGGDVVSVSGFTRTLARKIEVEDTAVAALEFRSGAIGAIEGTTSVYPETIPHRIEIHGDRGSIMVEGEGIKRWEVMGRDGKPVSKLVEAGEVGKAIASPTDIAWEGHRLLIQDMARAVLEDHAPLVTGEEARRGLELILAIYESSRKGERVTLPLKS